MKNIVLIDANNLYAKYYYGNKNECVDLLITTIFYLKKYFSAFFCCCVFDAEKSFRKNIYSDYKNNRNKEEDYYTTLENFKKTLKLNKIEQISSKSLEAEDSINLIVSSLNKQSKDYKFIILSEDKDLLLLTKYENCKIYKKYDELLTIPKYCEINVDDSFIEKYKLFFSINGDQSDNIPGIPNFGPKKSSFISNIIVSYENLKSILNSPLIDLELEFLSNPLKSIKNEEFGKLSSYLHDIKNHEHLLDVSYKLFCLYENEEYSFNINNYLSK